MALDNLSIDQGERSVHWPTRHAVGLIEENADKLLEKASWFTENRQPNLAEQFGAGKNRSSLASLVLYFSWTP